MAQCVTQKSRKFGTNGQNRAKLFFIFGPKFKSAAVCIIWPHDRIASVSLVARQSSPAHSLSPIGYKRKKLGEFALRETGREREKEGERTDEKGRDRESAERAERRTTRRLRTRATTDQITTELCTSRSSADRASCRTVCCVGETVCTDALCIWSHGARGGDHNTPFSLANRYLGGAN